MPSPHTPPSPDVRARPGPRWVAPAVLAATVPLLALAVLVLDEREEAEPDAEPVSASGPPPQRVAPPLEPGDAAEVRQASARHGANRRVTPPRVAVELVDGGESMTVATRAMRVETLLATEGVLLHEHDRVDRDLDEPLATGMTVTVERVEITRETQVEALAYDTVERTTDDRERGDDAVVETGEEGERVVVEEVVLVDGEEETREVVDETVSEPVDRVVEVGTADPAPAPSTARADEPVEDEPAETAGEGSEASSPPEDDGSGGSGSGGGDGVWDRLAECEANGNWSTNTGNGYYGGLQFHPDTWARHGGHAYASNAHQASRSQQITVAERVRASQGWGAWPACSSQLGLR